VKLAWWENFTKVVTVIDSTTKPRTIRMVILLIYWCKGCISCAIKTVHLSYKWIHPEKMNWIVHCLGQPLGKASTLLHHCGPHAGADEFHPPCQPALVSLFLIPQNTIRKRCSFYCKRSQISLPLRRELKHRILSTNLKSTKKVYGFTI